jgi:hypothetical protein
MLRCKLFKEEEHFQRGLSIEEKLELEREILDIKLEFLRQPILELYICIHETHIDHEDSLMAEGLDHTLNDWRLKAEGRGETLDCMDFMENFKYYLKKQMLNAEVLEWEKLEHWEMECVIDEAWEAKVQPNSYLSEMILIDSQYELIKYRNE